MLQAIKQACSKGGHYDYERFGWNLLTMWLDPFTKRKMNNRSRIIQVDGNIKCGKQDFAKRLADEMGMKYMPPVDIDNYYVNDHGYDYRALNPQLPERLRACDWEMFHENPSRHSVIHMQNFLFKLRLAQYIKALQHILNTGQGVVIGRSVFTERAIVEAMHDVGWLPMGYLRGDGVRFYDWKHRYIYIRNLALRVVLRPHLTIFLDTPVDVCMDNIKKSSDPMIRDSKAHVREFLEGVERGFKETVMPKQTHHGHLLTYEYPERATDAEIKDVVDDIDDLNFEYDERDTRFEDWNTERSSFWLSRIRKHYSTTSSCLWHFELIEQPYFDIAGMGDSITQTDILLRNMLFEANLDGFGWFTDLSTDTRFTSPLKAFFDYRNFGQTFDKNIRSDYI